MNKNYLLLLSLFGLLTDLNAQTSKIQKNMISKLQMGISCLMENPFKFIQKCIMLGSLNLTGTIV